MAKSKSNKNQINAVVDKNNLLEKAKELG